MTWCKDTAQREPALCRYGTDTFFKLRETIMFFIRKRGIKYLETSRGMSFTAHLIQTDTDVHMGMVEQRGVGGATTFLGATPHVDKMVKSVADHFGIEVSELMEYYMDIAEGFFEAEKKPLVMAIASYQPE